MNVHQVLTGALNSNDFSYAVGSVDGNKFIVCAVGVNVVILTSTFSRIQVINCTHSDVPVRALNCCVDSGKIAVSYGSKVRIFEPILGHENKVFPYAWHETQCVQAEAPVDYLEWVLDGLRLLVLCDTKLILYQHRLLTSLVTSAACRPAVAFSINDDFRSAVHVEDHWGVVWSTELSSKPKCVRFSPDSTIFATCGENDRFVKIWYPNEDTDRTSHCRFSFIYLQHPAQVHGFEWRRTGKYVPRKCVSNVINTWCADNTSRLWKQTPVVNDTVEQLLNAAQAVQQEKPTKKKSAQKSTTLKKARGRLITKITKLMNNKNAVGVPHGSKNAEFGRVATFADFANPVATRNVSFNLAATINADNGRQSQRLQFAVHWLNNKEMLFSCGAEKILAETLFGEQSELGGRSGTVSAEMASPAFSPEGTPVPDALSPTAASESHAGTMSNGSTTTDLDAAKDLLDVKVEGLIQQWNKSADILFAVHPVDGSLLTWMVEWLDDEWRQAVVSFSSRSPNAFPLNDAASLSLGLYVFSAHESSLGDLQRQFGEHSDGDLSHQGNIVSLLTSHNNGSLNLWHLCMEENQKYNNVVNVLHRYRMCGHRFRTNRISAHPILPLALTTSSLQSKGQNTGESELILWKVNPVGPLCKSGGVRELSRITERQADAFKCISWIPAIIPSFANGTVCNSSSSCFITSSNNVLSVYQAVVDASGLLSEIFSEKRPESRTSSRSSLSDVDEPAIPSERLNLGEMFKVVSTQSTGRPGCIIHLANIVEGDIGTDEILLLNVFNEALMSDFNDTPSNQEKDKTTEKFMVLLVQRNGKGEAVVRMWALEVCVQTPALVDAKAEITRTRRFSVGGPDFLATATNVQATAAELKVNSVKIFDKIVSLPDGVEVSLVVTCAGHLSSASVYPACRTPYFLVLSCTDGNVRFLRCIHDAVVGQYCWESWGMISGLVDSSVKIPGSVCALASAHSGRFACVYSPITSPTAGDISSFCRELVVAVYECETSGGVEWLLEERLRLDNAFGKENRKVFESLVWPGKEEPLNHDSDGRSPDLHLETHLPGLVRIDWASTEDGAHILTVGVANLIMFFAQTSQDKAQQNVAIMQESVEQFHRPALRRDSSLASGPSQQRKSLVSWVCIRYIVLESVDGLAPLPTIMSWTRDGLLVVGMPSEMRVYSQWNMTPLRHANAAEQHEVHKSPQKSIKVMGIRPVPSVSNLSTSHSNVRLDQLLKKTSKPIFEEFKHDSSPVKSSSPPIDEEMVDEGVFEAARLANPMLPQYHPKQLIEMLNAGKTKRVKAILLHVLKTLKQCQSSTRSHLSRAASVRRFNTSMQSSDFKSTDNDREGVTRQKSVAVLDDEELDYEELDGIPPLPLYALLEVDQSHTGDEKAANLDENKDVYNTLFDDEKSDEDLDAVLDEIHRSDTRSRTSRSRHSSTGSETYHDPNSFTARHSRALTELLTHTHLPGLSSVDQMHLLAVADTLSQFAPGIMDKLVQANAVLNQTQPSTLVDTAASGYANSGSGMEAVDECGLRFLMAMKQHEYLLLCLPRIQRQRLRQQGMPTSQIIWAFHSDAENELLGAVPCCQKGQETWDGLKAYGVAWWLKNTTTLKLIMEKVAKAAFQANQDPMDAALFYLAMRKKNILTHLFKTTNNTRMFDFFREDFSSERWKKAALKNAFVLMSKQRYQNAAAFFLLGNSLNDAIETILSRLKDLQLAMVVVRLYETDPDKQSALMENMLCNNIFGLPSTELHEMCKDGLVQEITRVSVQSTDPFERSMVLWTIKEYAMAAAVLVEEAAGDGSHLVHLKETASLSDIFNFYSFLRRNPLVVRQRLTNAGIQVASTEKFLAFSRHLESRVTPCERRLYFRTAAAHMASGCPLLALDVLSMLPRRMVADVDTAFSKMDTGKTDQLAVVEETVESVDWGAPTQVEEDDDLKLEWSDHDEEEENEEASTVRSNPDPSRQKSVDVQVSQFQMEEENEEENVKQSIDFIAQHMKFAAALKMMADELSTLASGFEVDGGELRQEMIHWLAKESSVLGEICNYLPDANNTAADQDTDVFKDLASRRKWLLANQKLIRTFASYCVLHSAQNHRLTSVLMELILLLLEVQQEANGFPEANVLQTKAFPLFSASVSLCRMFVSSPLNFLEDQCTDLLLTISLIKRPPPFGTPFTTIRKIYNLCQGLSSCLYQSLSSMESLHKYEELQVTTPPNCWPGVESLLALISAGRDDDAPNLRLQLVKVFVSVSASLFCYSMATYDARWLYRLAARGVDSVAFGFIFGGGGEKIVRRSQSPARPPPPPRPPKPSTPAEKSRVSYHAKVLGVNERPHANEKVLSCWVPPKKHLVQFFAEKIVPDKCAPNEVIFDSDQSESDLSDEDDVIDQDLEILAKPHKDPTSYAWLLIRFSSVVQQVERLKTFLQVAGFDASEMVRLSPYVHSIIRLFQAWSVQLQNQVENYPEGCPLGFLPSMYIIDENTPLTVSSTTSNQNPLVKKYKSLVEPNNTPFEYTGKGVLAVKRAWSYLIRQNNLSPYFVKYIYSKSNFVDVKDKITVGTFSTASQPGREGADGLRVVQREKEAIAAFACSRIRSGHLVVATAREMQELDLDRVLESGETGNNLKSSFLNNRVDLDIALGDSAPDKLRDNDDYQLISCSRNLNLQGSSFMQKRHISGVRRLEAHPTLPYYVSGASDGSIFMWEWNVEQPIFTARVAGQFAKVTKLAFALNGNKFASVDGDGHLCIWQATQQVASKKPFFNQKCHTKSAADLKFLGQSSSVLVTAGHSQGEMNVALWDTLLPRSRSMVYSFNGHVDGATCVSYFPHSQTIVSGGRHGEVCLWDLRQRQLRATVKAFDSAAVRSTFSDSNCNLLVTGSSEGDIKVWDINAVPQLLHTMAGEHSMRSGFSLRQVGSSAVQGVQQVYFDSNMRLFSCGADASLKIRPLPTF